MYKNHEEEQQINFTEFYVVHFYSIARQFQFKKWNGH